MNYKRLLIIFEIAIFVLFFFVNPVLADSMDENSIRFRWAFGALTGSESKREFVAISNNNTLYTGDQFKMFVELISDCYIYLFYQSPNNEFFMLFPYTLKQSDADDNSDGKYYIPKDEKWFQMDNNTGTEKFYLVGSSQRLHQIESLYNKYQSSPPESQKKITDQIINEIYLARNRYRGELKAKAEKPIPIGGEVRGTPVKGLPDVASIAGEISASEFCSRTFIIEHKQK